MTAQAKAEHPWTCIDDWRPSPYVYMTGARWNIFERDMWSSHRLFVREADAQADVDAAPMNNADMMQVRLEPAQ